MSSVNLREVVLDILLELEKSENFSHLVIGNALAKYQYLDKNQRKFISRLAQGTIERKIEEDYIINSFSKVPVNKMKPLIRNLLELSVYQLKYMDSVPASAVCNEAVKLTAKRGLKGLRGFVNGVLRKIAGNMDTVVYPDIQTDMVKFLSVTYSVPEWIITMWKETYSKDTLIKILEGLSQDKRTFIRCNTAKLSPLELKTHLEQEHIQVEEVRGIPYAFEIRGYDYISDIESFQAGEFQIQDISSMMAGEIAAPSAGDMVIDVCAAPGGKSINVALKAENVKVEARDLTEYKVSLIEENIKRLGVKNITAKVWDACQLDEQVKGKADIVIADLPCSGLGIMGRKPDIRYHMNQEKIKELVKLQRQILSVVWEYVKPGGYLVYSTCTIDYEENEKNANWFCEKYPFTISDLHNELPDYIVDFPKNSPIQLLPGVHGTDGFFIAKMRRNEV